MMIESEAPAPKALTEPDAGIEEYMDDFGRKKQDAEDQMTMLKKFYGALTSQGLSVPPAVALADRLPGKRHLQPPGVFVHRAEPELGGGVLHPQRQLLDA